MSNTTIAYSNGTAITPQNFSEEGGNVVIRTWVPEGLIGGIILRISDNKIYQYIGSFPYTTQNLTLEIGVGKWVKVLDTAIYKGFKSDSQIDLKAGISHEYMLPPNARIFALDVKGTANVIIGTAVELDDLGEVNSVSFSNLQLGFVNASSVFIKSDTDVSVEPIIYQK